MQIRREISTLVLAVLLGAAVLGIVNADFVGPSATPPTGDGIIRTSGGNVGIGVSSPQSILHIVNALPRILLLDSDAAISGSNPAWSVRASNAGTFIIQSTADYSAYSDRLTIASSGDVTIAQDLTVSGGDLTVTKINVTTIDPIYTIDGKRYATYVASMIGQKEEVTGIIQLDGTSEIDFRNLEEGSDLWLFGKATDLERNFDKMVVLLTASFPEAVWYEKDVENLRLVIRTEGTGEVSYRFTAPRFDWMTLPTHLPPGDISGLLIETDPQGKVMLAQ